MSTNTYVQLYKKSFKSYFVVQTCGWGCGEGHDVRKNKFIQIKNTRGELELRTCQV